MTGKNHPKKLSEPARVPAPAKKAKPYNYAKGWYTFDIAKTAAKKALGDAAGDACTFGTRFGVWWAKATKGQIGSTVQGQTLKAWVAKYPKVAKNGEPKNTFYCDQNGQYWVPGTEPVGYMLLVLAGSGHLEVAA
jgi:hypothetical protein